MIKTRFAPSPTGELHIGGARTALFAYLFAKSEGGEFLLRIEDTDRERFIKGSVERIIESLKWLGITPDNVDKPMIQSDRKEVYKKHAFDLVNNEKAYICTCTKEKLVADREKQEKSKLPPRYEGHCRDAKIDINDLEDSSYAVRMKMPENEKIVVNDLVRGKVEFDSSLIDDQIILKSDGFPTYHLAAVVDDHEMEITHIIRAEEWLSSTPKHIVLFKMFGWDIPIYAHLSMILGAEKKKMSKRHNGTSVKDVRSDGYLSESLINFMAFLGWNPKDDSKQFFTLDELKKEFKIENVNKAAAIFDEDKLNDTNEHYLRELSDSKLGNLMVPFGVDEVNSGESEIVKRGGYKTLKEAADYILKLRETPDYKSTILVFKKSDKEATAKGLKWVIEEFENVEDSNWNAEYLQEVLARVVSNNSLTNGDVFWPVRVALSGEERSPSPIELLVALEKEESIKRIEKAIELLR